MPAKRTKADKARWLAAQEAEKKELGDAGTVRGFIQVRKHTWARLIEEMRDVIDFDIPRSVLEIGSGPTSIFLALKGGERYAVDPNFDLLFERHPFVRELPEYQGVNFINGAFEDMPADRQFDMIFMINMLDHLGDLTPTLEKINKSLKPGGMLVIVVDCYADSRVKSLISFFDPDPPHPHHFINRDIAEMFSDYKLIKLDKNIYRIFDEVTLKEEKSEIPVYRIDRFAVKLKDILRRLGKGKDVLFISRYVVCFSLALAMAAVRRAEKPTYPLKKARLFVFRKEAPAGTLL
jgi:SAM-dependent methyltransferase